MWKKDIDLEKLVKIIGVDGVNEVQKAMKKENNWWAKTSRKIRRWYYYKKSPNVKKDLVFKCGKVGGCE